MKSFVNLLEEIKFHRNKSLNPKLWDKNSLVKPDVRKKLISFGLEFAKYCKIPTSKIKDILFVGGNASYFYNKTSDIDVHLLVDYNDFGKPEEVQQKFWEFKTSWLANHHNKIDNYPVEPYVQDENETPPKGQGVYSLLGNKWIHFPTVTNYNPDKDPILQRKIKHWEQLITNYLKEKKPISALTKLKDKITDMRTNALENQGELGSGNIVFKTLRMNGYLDKIDNYTNKTVDSAE